MIKQQPMRVTGDIAHDSIKIFALTRNTVEGDTPIKRWQFQNHYPVYPPGITASGPKSATSLFAQPPGGGKARVLRSAAVALRVYQLHGGYTPGPVFLLALLAGMAGIFTFRRRDPGNLALACLLVTGSAIAVLLGADLYEFSWRYQLPALVTLPIAGALGATAIARQLRRRRQAKTSRCSAGAGTGDGRDRAGALGGAGRRGGTVQGTDGDRRSAVQGDGEAGTPDIRMLAASVVYEDRWMRLRRDEIERRDGSRGTYAFVEKPDFALVIPAEDDGFHLVEEYRYPIGRRGWSFPQGGWPSGQTGSPAELARLELSQETGFRARSLVKLGFLHCAQGMSQPGRPLLPGHRPGAGPARPGARGAGHAPGVGAPGPVRGHDPGRPHHRRLHRGRLRAAADERAYWLTPSR